MSTVFGKYLLQRKIAEGGMAEVFLARQSGMDGFEKPVVIKRILPHLTGEQHFVDMFQGEARVAARLSHPAVVQIFDFGRIDGQYFIAMEFIHGEDLRSLAKTAEKKQHKPGPSLVARIVADMLGGLHYAHTRSGPDGRRLGLVHRDISPQNVLVTFEGGVKIVDFGIAKATQSESGQQTQAGMLKGKYAYMSPEQCRGMPLDARSDVFAAGILLWELLTWKRLFRRDSDLATLVAVADEPIPHPSALQADLPAELDRICMKALTRPLHERYASAQAMQADLEGLIRKQGWEADSIRLQRYMRDVFAEKLALQDEAIRAAGLGTIEDFLVRADEGTQMAWLESDAEDSRRRGQAPGLELPSVPLVQVVPTEPVQKVRIPPASSLPRTIPPNTLPAIAGPIAPVPNWPAPNLGVAGDTRSTLRGAAGQHPAPARTMPLLAVRESGRWRRVAVVAATSALVGGAGLGAIFLGGPSTSEASMDPVVTAAAGQGAGDTSRIKVILDKPGIVSVDGVAQPEATETEVRVSARAPHQLRVVAGAVERKLTVPPLEPGALQPIRMKLAQ